MTSALLRVLRHLGPGLTRDDGDDLEVLVLHRRACVRVSEAEPGQPELASELLQQHPLGTVLEVHEHVLRLDVERFLLGRGFGRHGSSSAFQWGGMGSGLLGHAGLLGLVRDVDDRVAIGHERGARLGVREEEPDQADLPAELLGELVRAVAIVVAGDLHVADVPQDVLRLGVAGLALTGCFGRHIDLPFRGRKRSPPTPALEMGGAVAHLDARVHEEGDGKRAISRDIKYHNMIFLSRFKIAETRLNLCTDKLSIIASLQIECEGNSRIIERGRSIE